MEWGVHLDAARQIASDGKMKHVPDFRSFGTYPCFGISRLRRVVLLPSGFLVQIAKGFSFVPPTCLEGVTQIRLLHHLYQTAVALLTFFSRSTGFGNNLRACGT